MSLGNLYKELWSRVGGRPWTYVLRDWWHDYEGLWIIGLVAIGATCSYYVGMRAVLIALAIFAVGFCFGHIFWGTRWKPGQTDLLPPGDKRGKVGD